MIKIAKNKYSPATPKSRAPALFPTLENSAQLCIMENFKA
jgi:hypothetical protein